MITVNTLLKKYKNSIINVKKLKFLGVKDKDVYNVTAPFFIKNKEYIIGRVESRNKKDSKIMFFYKRQDNFILDKKAPIFNLEDPFISFIDNQIIFGGVECIKNSYKTIFFKGKYIYSLKRFAKGPIGMKDIRFIELSNKKIGIFTRPQGEIGLRGRIGFFIIDSLNELKNLKDKDYVLDKDV